MFITIKKTFICLLITTMVNADAGLYKEQLMPALMEHVNNENPTDFELNLIHACRAYDEFGTKYPQAQSEVWQALKSIDMYTAILPQYARIGTHKTTAGYISLAKQAAQMTSHTPTLQQRTDLVRYFENNKSTVHSLEKILKYSTESERDFLRFFKQLSEEEQATLDTTNKHLYFSYFGLDSFNENATALEIGPRTNQAYTAAWFTIPPLITSFLHKGFMCFWNTRKLETEQAYLKDAQSTNFNYLEKRIEKLEAKTDKNWDERYELATAKAVYKYKDLTSAEIDEKLKQNKIALESLEKTEKELPDQGKMIDNLMSEIRKKDTKDLSDSEKNLLAFDNKLKDLYGNSNFYGSSWAKVSFGQALWTEPMYSAYNIGIPYAANATKHAITNLPNLAIDSVKYSTKALKYLITENPVYNNYKEFLVKHHKYDPNGWKTFGVATGTTALVYSIYAGILSIYPFMLYSRYKSTKNLLDLIYDKQKDLLSVAHLIKSMKMVLIVINKDPHLKELMPAEYKKLAELFDSRNPNTSQDLKKLIQLLQSSSFKGEQSYLLSQQGKILATHHLFYRIKGELIPYLEALGQVDANVTIFNIYSKFKNHSNAAMCLPQFVNSETPIVHIQKFWHPLIDPNMVITNDLILGGTNNPANLLITGPNAGGKTTSLMSLIINIIFAQSFGIAPSASFQLTPFAKIHSYLDITTNLQEGLSLFAAEVDRSKKLKASILSCTPGEKTFTIVDELFSGTAPEVASEIGFTFAKQLGEMKHSLVIITTHFPRLKDLEAETGRYENYKVADATVHEDGSITYPFKLVKGASTQNIAYQMLENAGVI